MVIINRSSPTRSNRSWEITNAPPDNSDKTFICTQLANLHWSRICLPACLASRFFDYLLVHTPQGSRLLPNHRIITVKSSGGLRLRLRAPEQEYQQQSITKVNQPVGGINRKRSWSLLHPPSNSINTSTSSYRPLDLHFNTRGHWLLPEFPQLQIPRVPVSKRKNNETKRISCLEGENEEGRILISWESAKPLSELLCVTSVVSSSFVLVLGAPIIIN